MISEYFYRLDRACESTEKWDTYLDTHKQEEKNHGRFMPSGTKPGLTHKQSIRLFAVSEIMKHLAGTAPKIEAKDYFTFKKSCFAAAAMFDLKREEIKAAFTTQEAKDFLSKVDYAELNKEQ